MLTILMPEGAPSIPPAPPKPCPCQGGKNRTVTSAGQSDERFLGTASLTDTHISSQAILDLPRPPTPPDSPPPPEKSMPQRAQEHSLGTASLTNGHQSLKHSLDQPGHVDSPFCTTQCIDEQYIIQYISQLYRTVCQVTKLTFKNTM